MRDIRPAEIKNTVRRAAMEVVKKIPSAKVVDIATSKQISSAHLLTVAKALAKSGDESAALDLLSAKVKSGTTREIYLYVAYLQSKNRQYEEAVATLQRAVQSGKWDTDAEINYQIARNARLLGDRDEAKKHAARAVAVAPTSQRYWQGLLDANSHEPVWRRLEILEEGYNSGLRSSDWLRQLADYRLQMNQYESAVELLVKLNEAKPEKATAIKLVEALFYCEGLDSAESFLNESAAQLDAATVKAGVQGIFLKRGQWRNVARARVHALKPSSTSADFHAAGYALMRSYRFEEAKVYLRKALAGKHPKAAWMYHLAFCEEKLGDFSAALDGYLTAYYSSNAPYHLYRALYVERFVENETRATSLLIEYLHSVYDERLSTYAGSTTVDPQTIKHAKQTRFRELVRSEACRLLALGEWAEADKHLQWLTETASELESEDYKMRSYISALEGDFEGARESFLETRDFRSAHGLDTSKYKARRDYFHLVFNELVQELEIDHQKVLYESNHGGKLTCNIYPLLRANLQSERGRAQTHIVVLNAGVSLPKEFWGYENIFVVERDKYAYVKHLATAGWVINNNTFAPYYYRRPEQKYLNTWHGTPLKSLGKDIRSGLMDHKNAARNFLQATHMVFPNEHTRYVLLNRYDVEGLYTGKSAITGYPRIDLTVNPDAWRAEPAGEANASRPTILYAPTWRGTLSEKKFDTEKLMADLIKLSELDAKVLFRPHPLMEDQISDLDIPVEIVSDSIDSNLLLGYTDILVTDYSSIFFDFYATGRPVFLYAYDRDEYFAERGAYFDMSKLPGVVVNDVDELATRISDVISSGELVISEGAIDRSEFSPMDDGRATERVLQFFFEGADDWNCSQDPRGDKPEVLFFQGSFIPNGITSSFLNLSNELSRSEIVNQTVVIQPEAVWRNPERFEKFNQLDDRVRAIGRVGGTAQTPEEEWLIRQFNNNFEFSSPLHRELYLAAFSKEFRRMFGEAEFDKVVCFEGYARFWAALFAASPVSRADKLMYLHSDMEREREKRFPYLTAVFELYREFGVLASVSESVNDLNRAELSADLHLAPFDSFQTVQNAIDIKQIKEKAHRQPEVKLNIPDDATVFVTAGRLTREKGHDILIDAFIDIAGAYPRAYLVIVGDGPLMEEYRIKIANAGLEERVLLPGYLENPLSVVAQGDCYVFPSRYEGQGLALIEGLVLGLPAIGFDVVGVKSVLANGGGRLVDLSTRSLAAAMSSFLDGDLLATDEFSSDEYQAASIDQFKSVLAIGK